MLGWCRRGWIGSWQRVGHSTSFLPSQDSKHWTHGRWCQFCFIVIRYL